jgi:hypothetical protein
MDVTKALMAVAVLAVAIAAVNVITTITQIGKVSGYYSSPIETGNATLIVQGTAAINFSNNFINWSTGYIISGATYAYLHTNYTAGQVSTYSSGGCIAPTCGALWQNISSGLRLQNVGNNNVNITLISDKDAAAFIGGTGPVYQWALNYDGNGTSCVSGLIDTNYANVATGSVRTECGNFSYTPNNLIQIDLLVGVPGNSPAGSKVSIITATASVL